MTSELPCSFCETERAEHAPPLDLQTSNGKSLIHQNQKEQDPAPIDSNHKKDNRFLHNIPGKKIQKNIMAFRETIPGACYLGNELLYCAWESSECGTLAYKSAREHGFDKKCMDNHRDLIGMCVDETLCTTHASNCLNPDRFMAEVPYCNIEYNRYPERTSSPYTLFGRCSLNGQDTCVWSETDCTAVGGTFQKPGELGYYKNSGGTQCTCDETKVGACRDGNNYQCAVSAEACSDPSQFLAWNEVQGLVDCRICADFPKRAVSLANGFPDSYKRLEAKMDNKHDAGLITGVAFGCFFAGIAIALASSFLCCRSRGVKTLEGHKGDGVPVV